MHEHTRHFYVRVDQFTARRWLRDGISTGIRTEVDNPPEGMTDVWVPIRSPFEDDVCILVTPDMMAILEKFGAVERSDEYVGRVSPPDCIWAHVPHEVLVTLFEDGVADTGVRPVG
jgi:hypothetical protein